MTGLILDLRFNPGGLLTAAIEVSDLFVADGRIVSTAGRSAAAAKLGRPEGRHVRGLSDRRAGQPHQRQRQRDRRGLPAGPPAGDDRRRADLGKGSVQNVIELEEGKSALKLTTAGYCGPAARTSIAAKARPRRTSGACGPSAAWRSCSRPTRARPI